MSRRFPGVARIGAAVALGATVIGVAAGCGDSAPNADVEAGKQSFVNLCSSCHTLQDSGRPASTVGPNLDDAFRAARQAGMDETVFEGVVRRWIQIAQPPMPRDLVTGQDAADVAAYVAKVAGTQPDSSVRAAQPFPPEAPDPARQELQ
jgi:mono/diheme cytochrome c family protein